jgi:hypothetical protein
MHTSRRRTAPASKISEDECCDDGLRPAHFAVACILVGLHFRRVIATRWGTHEGNARGIIDADMDELPADAMVMVDHAGLPSGDPISHRADAAELLNIEMDEIARVLAFIAPDRFGRLQG